MKILLKLSRNKQDLNHVATAQSVNHYATAPFLVSDEKIDYLFQLQNKILVKADIKQLSPKKIKSFDEN